MVELNFTNLEIELESADSRKDLIKSIKSLNVKNFEMSVKMPDREGFYVIKGSDTETLLNFLEAMVKDRDKDERRIENGKEVIDRAI